MPSHVIPNINISIIDLNNIGRPIIKYIINMYHFIYCYN